MINPIKLNPTSTIFVASYKAEKAAIFEIQINDRLFELLDSMRGSNNSNAGVLIAHIADSHSNYGTGVSTSSYDFYGVGSTPEHAYNGAMELIESELSDQEIESAKTAFNPPLNNDVKDELRNIAGIE